MWPRTIWNSTLGALAFSGQSLQCNCAWIVPNEVGGQVSPTQKFAWLRCMDVVVRWCSYGEVRWSTQKQGVEGTPSNSCTDCVKLLCNVRKTQLYNYMFIKYLSLDVINCIGQVLEARSFRAFWKRTLRFIVYYILCRCSINDIQFNSMWLCTVSIIVI